MPSAFKAAKNPDGAMLNDVLTPEAYATWLRLKQKYLGDDDDIEKYRPMIAEDKLNTAIGKKAMKAMKGLRFTSVDCGGPQGREKTQGQDSHAAGRDPQDQSREAASDPQGGAQHGPGGR